MDAEVVMSPARIAGFTFACLIQGAASAAAAPQAPPAPPARTPLAIVARAPVEVPAGLTPELGRVQVQLDAVVAPDGAVTVVRLVAVNILAQKVEMTADPAALQTEFTSMAQAAIASLRQWTFGAPQDAPAIVRVPFRFDIKANRVGFGSIRPVSGYPPNVTAALPSDTLKVGGPVATPKKILSVPPQYPPAALEAKVQGVVTLEVVLDADGVPADVYVVRGIPELDAAAIDAVKQWRYEPTLMNGVPVPVTMTVTVNFSLGTP
jgi:TonB family protein